MQVIPVLGVVGSAGRNDEAPLTTAAAYDAAYAALCEEMDAGGFTALVSGGAAFADHLAVRAFLAGRATSLRLHLPCAFDRALRRFARDGLDGARSNSLHENWRSTTGIRSLDQIAEAIDRGAAVIAGGGFLTRNGRIAADATRLLAVTFLGMRYPRRQSFGPSNAPYRDFELAGLRRGGTSSTWSRAKTVDRKILVNLSCAPAAAPPAPPQDAPAAGPASPPIASGRPVYPRPTPVALDD